MEAAPGNPKGRVGWRSHPTPEFARSRDERKKVEMLFAHLKTTLGFERMRLRGLSGAHDEFLMVAIAQNLRRMARLIRPEVLIPA